MNNEDLQKLKALAEAATRGPWGCFANEEDGGEVSHDVIAILSGVHIASEDHLPCEEDARYIAAASPDVILALIAKVESLAADADVVQIVAEVNDACSKWPPFNSAHEGFAVLKEEVDELWDEVKVNQKRRDLDKMKKEAKQVAAMALRFMRECCDEITGRK